jgi:hypothetical protein
VDLSVFLAALNITDLEVCDGIIVIIILCVKAFRFAIRLRLRRLGFSSRLRGSLVQLALATHLAQTALTALNLLVVGTNSLGRRCVPGDLSSEEIVDHHLCNTIQIGLTTPQETTTLASKSAEEVDSILRLLDTVGALQVAGLNTAQDSRNVLLRVLNILHTADTAQENVLLSVILVWRDNTRAIDEVDTLHQSDILPHLGLTRDRSDGADLLLAKSVDDGGLSSVGISNQADGDLLAVRMQGRKLAQKLDQRALAKGVVDRCVERKSGVVLRQMTNPSSLVEDAMLANGHQNDD